MFYGYIRISRREQNEGRQVTALKEHEIKRGIKFDEIFIDKDQSDNFDRPEYQAMRKKLRAGDEIIVKELDRLGRNYEQMKQEYAELLKQGIQITILDLPVLEGIQDPTLKRLLNDMIFQLLAYVAEKEKEKIRSRVKEGLDRAKAEGKKLGRPPIELPKRFDKYYERYKAKEITATEFAKIIGKSRSQFYRYIKYYEDGKRDQEQLDIDGHWIPVVDGEKNPKRYK